MNANFFNDFLQTNTLVSFGFILLIGLIGGQLAHIARYFPRVTGYIFFGFLLGPQCTGFLSNELIHQSIVFKDIAIGLILFELGLQIKLKFLRKHVYLIWTTLLQSLVVFLFIFFGLPLFHVGWIVSAICGAIGISVSPAITLLIANEYHAKGRVIHYSLILTALNNIISFLIYAVIVAMVARMHNQHPHTYVETIEWLYPFYQTIGAVILAYIGSMLIITLGRFLGKKENMQFILLIGMLVILLGLSKLFYVSPFLSMLMFGILTVNLDRKEYLMEVELGYLGEIFIVILFVIVGADLHMSYFTNSGWIVLAFIILRALGYVLPVFMMRHPFHFSSRQAVSLGITFLPMAGVAIALLSTTQQLINEYYPFLSFIILPAVAILEMIGPMTTIYSLRWSGELGHKQKVSH
jgi:Kef-type K+ transport system membrane component KefB